MNGVRRIDAHDVYTHGNGIVEPVALKGDGAAEAIEPGVRENEIKISL